MGKILVIDDDPAVRTTIRTVLEKAGHEVAEAAEGGEGLAIFRSTPFDLVICDLIMPEQEGMETIMKLKKEAPQLKIIAISGMPDTFLDVAQKLGATATLKKPFTIEGILNAVQEACSDLPERAK